jgi:hypothetical protein
MTNQAKVNLVTGNGFVVEAIVSSVKSIIVWS